VRSRLFVIVAVIPAAILLGACQATVRVNVDVTTAGSGTVSVTLDLDRSAAEAVGQLQLSDLQEAGWRISGPRPTAGGGLTVTASKPFQSPAEAQQIIGEVSGSNGPFRDLHISRRQSLLGSRTTVTARSTVDLTCGVQCFTDPALQQQLAGAGGAGALGGAGGSDVKLGFNVALHVPGKSAAWQGRLGDKTTLAATGRTWDKARLVAGLVLIALIVVLVAIVLVKRRSASRSRAV
jgi:hypothetical protein